MSLTTAQKDDLIIFLNYAKSKFYPLGSKPRLFIDGEFDSNQTKYERKSNHGKIGVVASSDLEAKVLLVYLRIIIDKNWEYLINMFDPEAVELNEKRILSKIALSSFHYVDWFLPNTPIVIELMRETIERAYDEVDKWDYNRIKDTINNLKTKD